MADGLSEKDLNILLESENESVSETSDAVENNEAKEDFDDSVKESKSQYEFVQASYQSYLMSRDGRIKWSPTSTSDCVQRVQSQITMGIRQMPGPTAYATDGATDVKSTFLLFFPPVIVNKIVKVTNVEGAKMFPGHWETMSETDLHCYLGLIILTGVFRSHNEPITSLWDERFGRPIFRAAMSLKRFRMISRVIRFDDKSTLLERRMKDRLAPIREIWDRWVSLLPKYYHPSENMVIDEQLLPFRGRCPFRQYAPSKSGKHGIKIWVICECRSSYVWGMQIHTEKEQTPENVVLNLSKGLNGHNITCDSFFTSYDLGQELLKKNITILGTVDKNKPEVPHEFLLKREAKSSVFGFTNDTTIVSYVPKKNKTVVVMSTLHRRPEIQYDFDAQPQILVDYNKTKGGVHGMEQQISKYTCKRKTNRWPLVVFSNMVDVSAFNAFVIWEEVCPNYYKNKTYKWRLFLEELGRELVTPKLQSRSYQPRTSEARDLIDWIKSEEGPSTSFGENVVKKRRRCSLCPKNCDNKYKDYCDRCRKCICKRHMVTLCSNCV